MPASDGQEGYRLYVCLSVCFSVGLLVCLGLMVYLDDAYEMRHPCAKDVCGMMMQQA